MKTDYLRQAWLVLALSLGFGAALAGVQLSLDDVIQENKRLETEGQIPKLVPGAVKGNKVKLDDLTVYEALASDGGRVGWVVQASGQGFADVIELLIGLDEQGRTIKGLYVLSQKETPNLGNRIAGPWRNNFVDKEATAPLTVSKAPQPGPAEIPALTGATISSEAVTDIVNQAAAKLRAALEARQPHEE